MDISINNNIFHIGIKHVDAVKRLGAAAVQSNNFDIIIDDKHTILIDYMLYNDSFYSCDYGSYKLNSITAGIDSYYKRVTDPTAKYILKIYTDIINMIDDHINNTYGEESEITY